MDNPNLFFYLIQTLIIIFEGLYDDKVIDIQIISEANFENLRLLEKNELQYEDQLYEDVDGFDSLRKIDTIHQQY